MLMYLVSSGRALAWCIIGDTKSSEIIEIPLSPWSDEAIQGTIVGRQLHIASTLCRMRDAKQ